MIDRSRIAELRDEVGQDDLLEVVALFCEEVEETLLRLSQPPVRVTAHDLHFLKGSALNIGMTEVSEKCSTFEKALRADPDARLDLEELTAAFHESHQALGQEVKVFV